MLLLIEYYKKYTNSKELKPTKEILTWTNQYKENTDIYLQFLNECTEESETHIHTAILYESFKEWFKINNPGTKLPSNKNFTTNLKKYKKIEAVRVDTKSSCGIKNLKIKYDV
jgi:phage/plasmid-associated DNA primase